MALGLFSSFEVSPIHAAELPGQSLSPTSLSLSIIPPSLPADNNTYPAVVVSVVDSTGRPTVALTPVNVSLTSSESSVGTITPTVQIGAGETYAIAKFTTTHTAGTTSITATTTGMTTATAAVTTVIAVGYPTHLFVEAVPSTLPASAAGTGTLILELQDDVGLPAKAISNVPISIYSSNTNVVNVTAATTVMAQGDYLEEVNYTSGFVPGSAVLTASAPGFSSGQSTITVIGSPPLALKLLAQPSTMVACDSSVVSACQGRLVVALTDLSGNPTLATRDIEVQIRSSDLAVVNASETTTIQEGNISATATFLVTATSVASQGSDSVTITASSPGLQSSFTTITIYNPATVSPTGCTSGAETTCQLAIYSGPNPVLADHRSYSSVVVSLQEPSGIPAINSTGPTQVTLTSSVTGVGNFTSITFDIPEGQNWASVTFTSTFQVGTTDLTASAENMLPIQTQLATYGPVPSQVVLSPLSKQLPADGAAHPALELALEDAQGDPAIAASDVPVSLTSSEPAILGVADAVIPAGKTFAIVNVTAGILEGTANVTALVSSFTSGYASSSVDVSTVIPAPSQIAAVAPNDNTIMYTTDKADALPLLAVQLQDAQGNPARARAPMNITITSSNSTVISSVLSTSVAVGADYVTIPIAAKVPGVTTLTLSTPGLAVASIALTFLAYPNSETINGGPARVFTNQTAVVSVTVTLDGLPLLGAPISWNSTIGGLTIVPVATTTSTTSSSTTSKTTTTAAQTPKSVVNGTTSSAGVSTVIFHPTAIGSALITASIAPGGFLAHTLNFTVQVVSPPPPKLTHKTTLVERLTTFPLVLAPVGGGAAVVAAVFVLRRRRGGGGGEEEFDSSFE